MLKHLARSSAAAAEGSSGGGGHSRHNAGSNAVPGLELLREIACSTKAGAGCKLSLEGSGSAVAALLQVTDRFL